MEPTIPRDEEPAPPPDLARTRAAVESPRSPAVGITVLAVLALLYTLYFARAFLVPVAFAVLLSFLFSPVVRALSRARVRPPLGAALVVLGLLGVVGGGIWQLSGPVRTWAENAPETLSAARDRLRGVLAPIQRASETAERVESAAGAVGGAADAGAPEVVVKEESLVSRLFGTTRRLLVGALEVVVLLYFLLASGDLFLQKLVKVLPDPADRRKAVAVTRATESSLSAYLLTTAAINLAEGTLVAAAMWLLGMPNPLLWGALTFVMDFVPYLGSLVTLLVLGVAAVATFESVPRALLVPAVFLAINAAQANLVSPLLHGRRLALNPVAILVGLAFWYWIWGIAGAFVAVPILAAFKILCDHVESLAAIGEFLGVRDEGERRATVR